MKKIKLLRNIMSVILIALIISACSNLNSKSLPTLPQSFPELYSGMPEINKLTSSIIANPLFNGAPLPHVNILTYESIELATGQKFSRYQIHLLETKGYITRYRTREVDPKNTGFYLAKGTPIIRGEGVGYGGIFMLAYEKGHFVYGKSGAKKNYYKKYEMTAISDVQGKLFPLAVGNKLSFHYTEISKNKRTNNNQADMHDSGTFIYQVINHLNSYNNSAKPVTGNIYVIRVSRTTQNNPRLMPMYEYYFSEQLGWYIVAKYFRDGKQVAIYRLINWE